MGLGDREFTSEEVAALCGVTRVTVADWIARGELEARWTMGGHRRIPRASLAVFMEKQGYPAPRAVSSSRVHVVVVDDEREWRDRIRDELAAGGEFDVQAFRPGADALLAIGAMRPDLLLLDTRMPGFDASQLLQAIRAVPELGETTVVALTTWDEEGAAARRFGAHAVLPKRRASELLVMVARILSERQRRTASGEPELDSTRDAEVASELGTGAPRSRTARVRSGKMAAVRPLDGAAALPDEADAVDDLDDRPVDLEPDRLMAAAGGPAGSTAATAATARERPQTARRARPPG